MTIKTASLLQFCNVPGEPPWPAIEIGLAAARSEGRGRGTIPGKRRHPEIRFGRASIPFNSRYSVGVRSSSCPRRKSWCVSSRASIPPPRDLSLSASAAPSQDRLIRTRFCVVRVSARESCVSRHFCLEHTGECHRWQFHDHGIRARSVFAVPGAGDDFGRQPRTGGGGSKQAACIEETSASLEEMASMTKLTADSAGHANQIMGERPLPLPLPQAKAGLINSIQSGRIPDSSGGCIIPIPHAAEEASPDTGGSGIVRIDSAFGRGHARRPGRRW